MGCGDITRRSMTTKQKDSQPFRPMFLLVKAQWEGAAAWWPIAYFSREDKWHRLFCATEFTLFRNIEWQFHCMCHSQGFKSRLKRLTITNMIYLALWRKNLATILFGIEKRAILLMMHMYASYVCIYMHIYAYMIAVCKGPAG